MFNERIVVNNNKYNNMIDNSRVDKRRIWDIFESIKVIKPSLRNVMLGKYFEKKNFKFLIFLGFPK